MNPTASPPGAVIRDIPLSRLFLAPENVRKTPVHDHAQAELEASIRAHGLLANLTVYCLTRMRWTSRKTT